MTNRGHAYMSHGDYDLAVEDFDRALTLDPDNAQAMQGRLQARLEKVKQSSAKGIAIDPGARSNDSRVGTVANEFESERLRRRAARG